MASALAQSLHAGTEPINGVAVECSAERGCCVEVHAYSIALTDGEQRARSSVGTSGRYRRSAADRQRNEQAFDHLRSQLGDGALVKITFLGRESGDKDCPTIYATDRDTVLVQGWRVCDPEAVAEMDVPDHETVVEVPRGLLRFVPPEA